LARCPVGMDSEGESNRATAGAAEEMRIWPAPTRQCNKPSFPHTAHLSPCRKLMLAAHRGQPDRVGSEHPSAYLLNTAPIGLFLRCSSAASAVARRRDSAIRRHLVNPTTTWQHEKTTNQNGSDRRAARRGPLRPCLEFGARTWLWYCGTAAAVAQLRKGASTADRRRASLPLT
jgi:hypothetical protein